MSDAGSQFPHLSVEGLIFPFPIHAQFAKLPPTRSTFPLAPARSRRAPTPPCAPRRRRPISRHKRLVLGISTTPVAVHTRLDSIFSKNVVKIQHAFFQIKCIRRYLLVDNNIKFSLLGQIILENIVRSLHSI